MSEFPVNEPKDDSLLLKLRQWFDAGDPGSGAGPVATTDGVDWGRIVPFAAMQDAKLYELLALFDALRVGKARERGMALERLQALIDPDAPTPLKEALRG